MNVVSRTLTATLAVLLLSAPCSFAQRLSESTGVNLFKDNCTSCHGVTPVERAPTEATIKDNSDMVEAFVRATLKGMRDAFANPAEAGAILNKYHKQISPQVAQGETELVRELATVPGQRMGMIDQARIKSTIAIMEKSFPVKTAVAPQEMFVPGFVE